MSNRLSILRIRRPPNLVTAQAYEELFDRQLGTTFDVSIAPLESWCDAVLGPAGSPVSLDAAALRFRSLAAQHDFFCPSYECIPLAPLLLAVRNRAVARTRMLFIAHAAGAYSYEWALMRPLLAAGDVIIAPSESARRTIDFLCPDLAPYVRVVPHPMAPLARITSERRPRRVVSLGRIHAEKLTHRQIEAMAVLRGRGVRGLQMEIGGPLDDGGWDGPHPYTRTLSEKVRRYGLENTVSFAGAVRGDEAKSAFLSGADALINLSITIEESFPKTPVEALGVGVPVVGTDWNGLRDTVGSCGQLVPVVESTDVVGAVDVDPEHVADALEALLDAPPTPFRCMAWTEQFAPVSILPRYRAALEDGWVASGGSDAHRDWPAAGECAAPETGFLSRAAPLDAFSWREAFDMYLTWVDGIRRGWTEPSAAVLTDGGRMRGIVLKSVEPVLRRFFANLSLPPAPARLSIARTGDDSRDLIERLAQVARSRGSVAGRAACLYELIAANRLADAAIALDTLETDGLDTALVAFWRSDIACASGDTAGALSHALAAVRDDRLGESDWPLVRQAARAARRAEDPGAALPMVLAWLQRFPDAQESGPIWLDACVNTLRVGGPQAASAEVYFTHARTLLGEIPAIAKCGVSLQKARSTWGLVA